VYNAISFMSRSFNPVAIHAKQRGFLTIKALMQRSGAHRQTIHYYLRKGLLPVPTRTSKTSALYPPGAVELVHLVRVFQEQRRLKLDEIATIFQSAGYDPRAIRQQLAMERGSAAPGARYLTLDELRAELDPPPQEAWIQDLVKRKLLEPETISGKEMVPPNAVEMVRSLWQALQFGVDVGRFEKIARLVDQEVDLELDQFHAGLNKLALSGNAYQQVAQVFDAFGRFASFRRRVTLHKYLRSGSRKSAYLFIGQNRKYVFPSETFLERMGLSREIDRLHLRLERNPQDMESLKNLARAYNLRSDWHRLHEVCHDILRQEPDHSASIANVGMALIYLGRAEEAVAFLENAMKRVNNPLVKLRLSQALVLRANHSGDASVVLDAIARAARLSAEAIKESTGNPSLYRKIRLIQVLDQISLSDPLSLSGPSLEELEWLYREYRNLDPKKLDVLGKISHAMAVMFAAFALYLGRMREGRKDAEQLRREIVRIDPSGILAARSLQASREKPAKKSKTRAAAARSAKR
jgi:DNA-binding transcriptional MerR regulator/DNA-binding phage protein